MGDSKGSFSMKICYLLNCSTNPGPSGFHWELLWKAHIHDRLKVFLWRLFAQVLPVNFVVFAHNWQTGSTLFFV